MLDSYTMQLLNAERLKDLDRESVGLRFSRLARRNRKRAQRETRLRLARLLISAGERIQGSLEENTRRLSLPD